LKMASLKKYRLKFVLPPPERHLIVLVANEKEALLMRTYLVTEGFEV